MNLVESLKQSLLEGEGEDAKIKDAEKEAGKAEESIKDEKTFRDYAENKFKEAFGDELDEKQMKETIDGIIKDSQEEIEAGDWGAVVGKLNKSFGD